MQDGRKPSAAPGAAAYAQGGSERVPGLAAPRSLIVGAVPRYRNAEPRPCGLTKCHLRLGEFETRIPDACFQFDLSRQMVADETVSSMLNPERRLTPVELGELMRAADSNEPLLNMLRQSTVGLVRRRGPD